jgi:hypothetical protein
MLTATQKEDRKAARGAFRRCLDRVAGGNGVAHARVLDDAADYGLMAGHLMSRIIAEMVAAGVAPDDAAVAVLHSRQR